MAVQISFECLCEIAGLCEERYKELVDGGCMDDVAADRIFDALRCALEKTDAHCFDPRDRLFESRLRTEAKKGTLQ